MASHLFLISYILDDQPMTCELHSEADTLSREEARRHLEALASTARRRGDQRYPGQQGGAYP